MANHERGWLVAVAALLLSGVSQADTLAEPATPTVHVHRSSEAGIFANAYLVETAAGVIAVDATLTNSESKALHAQLEALRKPLLAVLVTHGHPDHYNGLNELVADARIPIFATQAVCDVIKRDDAAKEQQWKPVFKDEWPIRRRFPDRSIADGDSVTFGGVTFTVHALGPGESDADSVWVATAPTLNVAFIGDVVLHDMHAFLSDGHSGAWLRNIERVRELTRGAQTIYPGHGASGDARMLDWQRDYLQAYRGAVARLAAGEPQLTEAQKDQLEARMLVYHQSEQLRFLIKLGADPVAAELAHEPGAH